MKKLKQNVSEDHRGREYSSDSISVDLLIDIFLRVPPKSIARFRCVSKYWSSILGCQDFTESFMTKSLTRPQLLFTFQEHENLLFYSSPQPQNPDENSSPIVANHLVSIPTNFSSRICRPVNGLICLADSNWTESVTTICNLTTGEFDTLPEVEIERSESISYFGYDPIKKQFKIYVTCGRHNITSKVLTLGNGKKQWRKTKLRRYHYPLFDGICINGVLYYPANTRPVSEASMIVCFDVRSEKFSSVNIKQGMVIRRDSILINYKGKLGVLAALNDQGEGVNEKTRAILMWILEDAEKHEWSKHVYKLPNGWWEKLDNTYLCFVGVTSLGEIVLSPYFVFKPLYIFYYNPDRKTIRRVEVQGIEASGHPKFHVFIDYVENVTPMQMLRAS